MPGGQHHQLPVRDDFGRLLGDRTSAERVMFAPYNQRGHRPLAQLVGSYARVTWKPEGDSKANGETYTRISDLALDAAIGSRPVITIRPTKSGWAARVAFSPTKLANRSTDFGLGGTSRDSSLLRAWRSAGSAGGSGSSATRAHRSAPAA